MHVVTVMNPKGGVGKSTLVHQISAALALAHNLRVLVVDATPQASVTKGWLGPAAARDLEPARTAAAILGGLSPSPARVIRATGVAGLSLIPGSEGVNIYAGSLLRDPGERIREFLREVDGAFDVVMVDTPPGLPGGCAYAALAASDWLVVPVRPDAYGTQGLVDVLEFLEAAWSGGYETELLGFLLARVEDRSPIHRLYEGRLRSLYGEGVFEAALPDRSEFFEPVSSRRLIDRHRANGKAAKAAKAVSNELISRIARGKAGGRHRGMRLDHVDLHETLAAFDEKPRRPAMRSDAEAA